MLGNSFLRIVQIIFIKLCFPIWSTRIQDSFDIISEFQKDLKAITCYLDTFFSSSFKGFRRITKIKF